MREPRARAEPRAGREAAPQEIRHRFGIEGLDRHGLEAFRLELQRMGRIKGFEVREFRVEADESS